MNNAKILVTGVTGNQGGAVARHLLKQSCNVRGLTRNLQSASALALAKLGVEIVQGDLNDPTGLDRVMRGCESVFSVQDYWAKNTGYEGEVKQGLHLADAAKRAGVKHFVQSAMAKANHFDGVEHFQSKQVICEHIQSIGLDYTIIGTVYFMDNILDSKKGGSTIFPLLSGALEPSTRFHMLAVDDLGAIVSRVLIEREPFFRKHLDIASDCLTVDQMKAVYRTVSGKLPKRWKMPRWVLRLFVKEIANQLQWQNSNGWHFSLDAARAIYPRLTSFEAFLKKHQVTDL